MVLTKSNKNMTYLTALFCGFISVERYSTFDVRHLLTPLSQQPIGIAGHNR
jgi:hypothetical protein